MNLGSPDSTEIKDVKKYLDQFLMDEKVIDYPYLLRALLVKGLIIPLRVAKSAGAYKTIWTNEGSPLVEFTKQLRDKLQEHLSEPVEIAMRYGNPSPKVAFDNLMKINPAIDEVIAIPLYPHYAMSSYETAVEYASEIHEENKYPFRLTFIRPFYNEQHYISALAESMKPYLQEPYDHILFSYHGIPERHIKKSDPTGCHCLKTTDCCEVSSPAHDTCYRHQVRTTTRLVTSLLGIPTDKFSISFQSRLGKGWLQPFTDIRLEEMPKEGIKNLVILCPAFVSDCLETLEEIADRGKESFLKAGGETYRVIPCLNIHPLWIEALRNYIETINESSLEMVLQ